MSVEKDEAAGTRQVTMEVEVPGTTEQVWQAVATGPGTSAWFVPTEIEERVGGEVAFDFGPEMGSSKGVVTGWDPPRRFAYEERDWMPGAPPVATEIVVEARGGGTCTVRMVHSLFTEADDWDDQLESFERGWPPFFRLLRLYLAHFAGRRCSSFRATGRGEAPESRAWSELVAALGLEGAAAGEAVATTGGAPDLSGAVEHLGAESNHHEILVRLDRPAPGYAFVGTFAWGESVYTTVSAYLFGDDAPAVAEREGAIWQSWLEARSPAG